MQFAINRHKGPEMHDLCPYCCGLNDWIILTDPNTGAYGFPICLNRACRDYGNRLTKVHQPLIAKGRRFVRIARNQWRIAA